MRCREGVRIVTPDCGGGGSSLHVGRSNSWRRLDWLLNGSVPTTKVSEVSERSPEPSVDIGGGGRRMQLRRRAVKFGVWTKHPIHSSRRGRKVALVSVSSLLSPSCAFCGRSVEVSLGDGPFTEWLIHRTFKLALATVASEPLDDVRGKRNL